MGLKVLIAPDKFKGTLSAQAAAEAMARGWQQQRPGDTLELLPVSDGGEGFGELVGARVRAEGRVCATVDAAHRPCKAPWWQDSRSGTAIIEAARINGLAQLPPGRYHPFELDTYGLGAAFRAAAESGCQRCLVGIGGSATNDSGFGLARSLGWVFLDGRGVALERWTDLHNLHRIQPPSATLAFKEVLVAVDVQNRLLGPTGCTRVYGPQKGLRPQDYEPAERCLSRLAEVISRQTGQDLAEFPGAGAAGGLGFGLLAFLGARLEPGFALFARQVDLAERVRAAQLVVTGEGCLDGSTLMGKGVGELAVLCRETAVPCLILAGAVTDAAEAVTRFERVCAITPDLTTREQALSEPARWLEELASRVAAEWPPRRAPRPQDRHPESIPL